MYKNNPFLAFVLSAFVCFGSINDARAADCKACDWGEYFDASEKKCKSCKTDDFYSAHPGCICPKSICVYPQDQGEDHGYEPCMPSGSVIYYPNKNGRECEKLSNDVPMKSVTIKKGEFAYIGSGNVRSGECGDSFYKFVKKLNPDWATTGKYKYSTTDTNSHNLTTYRCGGSEEITLQIPTDSDHRVYKTKAILGGFSKCAGDVINDHYAAFAYDNTNYTICESEPYSHGQDSNGNQTIPDRKCTAGEFIPKGRITCAKCSILGDADIHYGCTKSFEVSMADLPAKSNTFAPGMKDACVYDKDYNKLQYGDADRSFCKIVKCGKSGYEPNGSGTQCVEKNPSSNNSSSSSNNVKINADLAGKFNPNSLNNIKTPTINANLKLTDVTCAKGEVWANQGCVKCNANNAYIEYFTNVRSYCPGGSWPMGTLWTAQIKKCPEGQWPTGDMSKCECGWAKHKKPDGTCTKNMTFDKDDLYYGPKGKSAPINKQCWTKNSADSYKLCMGFDD